ncbi:hypothetical protein FRC00_009254 [Tulasnella sp. 408]|nr:hypothetical protein FRC00_009254 [Tulasnella sp. 408]
MDQIKSLENARDVGTRFVFMRLESPPSFEKKPQFAPLTGDPNKDFKHSWERLSSLEPAHERVVAFASRALRLVIMPHPTELKNFIEMSEFVKLPPLKTSSLLNTAHGEQYSRKWLDDVKNMSGKFPWPIAFQCDVLLRKGSLLPREILKLKREIGRLVTIGTRFAEEVLKRVRSERSIARNHLIRSSQQFIKLAPDLDENEGIVGCLRRAEEDCNKRGISFANLTPRLGVFRSRHVLVTPTCYELQGPEDEQSNRVIRLFGPAFEDRFIRVAFADEGGTLYRRDWEVDNNLGDVNAQMIRDRLGDFSRVIKCPARYAARIAQAFSATDPSVEIQPNEIEMINDVETETQLQYGGSEELKARKYVWTDGHGTISPDLADEIWTRLCEIRPKRVNIGAETEEVRPRAYQVRIDK